MVNRLKVAFLRVAVRAQSHEAGQGLAEYALLLALIAIVCIGALSAMGLSIAQTAGFVALPGAL
ncbi:MAG: hypothetical protein AB7J35_04155 [Dehalococcoidia bacterium]